MISAKLHSFTLFLTASFICGTGNAFLQAAVNLYVTILGPVNSAAQRMSIMGICNKLGWGIAPIFLVWIIGKDISSTLIADLSTPFWIIILIFILLGIASLLAPLPEVTATGETQDTVHDCPYAEKKTSIWQFPHLIFGAVALFAYVGVETISLGTVVDYANSMQIANASNYGWISSVGLVLGYVIGIIIIPKYINQALALRICALLGMAGSLGVVFAPIQISIWFIGVMALGCSLIWPSMWPLAIVDLGRFIKKGSSLLVMSIAGGAVIPTAFGFMKDIIGTQQAY